MPTIDELSIEIDAKAKSADSAIDGLCEKLDSLITSISKVDVGKLNNLASGIQRLGVATKEIQSIDKRSFTSVATKIKELSAIDTSKFATVSANLHQMANGINSLGTVSANVASVGELAKNIGKLGNKSVQTAVTNIPQLATALNGLMTTLSHAPTVSQNVIDMTNALANLSAQGSKVGSASNSIVKGLNKASTSATKAKGSFKGLASAFGKFYANCFLVIRGVKSLWNSINSTADYLEAFNYFEVALNKVGGDWASDWEKYSEKLGVTSAEEYANSFKTRLNENLKGLSGVQISVDADGKTGLLTDTGMKNLGLNIQEVTQYASQLASVTNSVGQTGEVTLATASAFTKLGADMSSLFNVDYSSVMNNLQSGLIGQSRALYKYGIDITNATLQTYAYELGVEKAVSEMTQAEKMQLRMIAILDQSRVSWGDQANTINSLSNSIRQFKNNISEAGQILGQLFVPILSKVMPVVNGLTIAIKRLMVSVANILGIRLDLSEFGQGASDITDDMDGLSDSLDGVADSAEKAKKGIRAFDELKTIDTSSQSGSGTSGVSGSLDLTQQILDATAEYEAAWQEAYNRMEAKAVAFADRIETALEPIKQIFEDFAVGDFFQAGQDVSNLVVSITDFFANAIDNVDWYGIGTKIGDFLAGINWLDVFESAANLAWQGLKAALELAIGVFDSAPLETALISLATMPKWLEAITATKFVTGFKKLGNAIKLVVSGLAGNKASTKLLIRQYPKLGKAVDVARKAFANFKFGLENGNILTGLNEGISTIRGNLTGLQKGAITAVAGFAEFRIVKTSFEDIVSGSENVVASIAKIAGAVGIAAAAMYTALGPAGLAIAGITGVVGAISGINEAFDNIRAEEIGQSIKNAMTVPGGVPLSEIVNQFQTAFSEASNGFDLISEKSSEMDNVQKNIENTWTEIYKIEEAMENGVLSVEEGKTQLETLFSELATLTEQKFSTMNSVIMSAYGENGSFRTALDKIGADIETAIDTMITYGYQNSERAKEITQELAGVDVNSEEYRSLTAELASLTGEMSSFEKATSDFTYNMNVLQGKIDYSEIFLENGSVDTEALKTYLSQATEALDEYKTSLDTAGQEVSQYWQEIYNSPIATEEQRAIAKSQLDYIPQAVEEMKSEAELQIVSFTDMLQNDFISKTNQIIEDNLNEWNEKSAVEKWWNGVWGAGNEGEYVKEAVDQQQENINELSNAIEESLGELETDGVVWASEAAEEIYGALFDSQYIHSEMGLGHYKYTLNENYKEIINGATEGISELAGERGKDAVDGYSNGITDNTSEGTEAAKTFIDKVMEKIAETQDSHSPSKVTESLGKDAVDGYILGFSKNQNTTLSAISAFVQKSLDKFRELVTPIHDIGVNVMQGLYDGLSSMENTLYEKVQSIADNIADTVKTALDIHSPSRVMAELGEYTIAGFKEGMENLYKPTLKSLQGFSYNVEIAPVPSLTSMYESYHPAYANAYTPSYSDVGYLGAASQQNNTETNALLRELLTAVRQGKVIEMDGREIARQIQKEDTSYYRRTGSGMFQH